MSRSKSLPRKKTNKSKFDKKLQTLFLKVFSECNSIRQAALACQISPTAVYKAKKDNPEFAKLLQEAEELVLDNLEKEAYRRAVKGVKKPVYYQGQLVGYELTYSDKLLEMLLRGRDRERYGNNTNLNVSGEVNHNIKVDDVKDRLMKMAISRGAVIEHKDEAEDADFEEVNDSKDDEDECQM